MFYFYRIGYIITVGILLVIAYRVKVSGFKGYFHDLTSDLTEILGREKSLFYKMNSFCLVASGLLAPVILVAFPKFANQYPDLFESTKNVLLHVIALIIFIAALLGGILSCYLCSLRDAEIREGEKRVQMIRAGNICKLFSCHEYLENCVGINSRTSFYKNDGVLLI